MNDETPYTIGITGAVVTLLLVWVGLAMANDAPSPADAAVGKGLITLGVATALVTIGMLTEHAYRQEKERRAQAAKKPQSYRDADGL